jgi:hypothetical protein
MNRRPAHDTSAANFEHASPAILEHFSALGQRDAQCNFADQMLD